MKNEDIDVLVIGAGAAGAALSWSLTEKGAKVVCLEQGGWIDPLTFPSQSSALRARPVLE